MAGHSYNQCTTRYIFPGMNTAPVEVTVQVTDHLSWAAGKNKSNSSGAQEHKGPLDRQASNTSIWQWQQQLLYIPTSQSSGEPHLQKSVPRFFPIP